MNIFKLAVADLRHYPLEKQGYMNKTGKRTPYYVLGEDGKMKHYAVCPSCDNPIQIIGLVEHPSDEKIHARHVPKSIHNLAPYRDSAYKNCPLAAKNRIKAEKNVRKIGEDNISQKILNILREHFDRVIRVLEKSLGFRISEALAASLLDDYLGEEGHRYKFASLVNIPWMLGFMSMSKNLVGRLITDEDMKKCILAKVPNAVFEGDKLVRKGKEYLMVNMFCSEHVFQPRANMIEESMTLNINTSDKALPNIIYKKRIVFDYADFQHFLEIPEGKGYRNQALLNLAKTKLT